MASNLVRVSLPHAWHHIRLLRKKVAESFGDDDAARRSAATMTASELVENAVKYGEDVPAASSALFSMLVEPDLIRIEVSNGCTDAGIVRELERRVDEISREGDKEALYMRRLEELLAHPSDSGKLGLYRIAFEGRFDLRCTSGNDVVTMTATRTGR